MDLHFRTHVPTPSGSRIIAGTAEVVGIPGRPGWQLRSAYVREGLRYRAADFWELAAVKRYTDREDVHEEITKLWAELRDEPEMPREYKERQLTYQPTPSQAKVLAFVLEETGKGKSFPSYRAICDHMGWSKAGSARDVLMTLSGMGFIARHYVGSRRIVFDVVDKADAG